MSSEKHIEAAKDWLSDSKNQDFSVWERMVYVLQAIAHANIAAVEAIQEEIDREQPAN